jgi:hypothetical protein
VAQPVIWKEIVTAFEGRAIGESYPVEDGIVRVTTPRGEKTASLGGTDAIWVAGRLREMATGGKA